MPGAHVCGIPVLTCVVCTRAREPCDHLSLLSFTSALCTLPCNSFAGVNQEDRLAKSLGVASLPLYVAAAIEVCFFYTREYEGRAWTRLERVLGYVFNASPMFVMIDENYLAKEMPSLERLAKSSGSVFMVNAAGGGIMMSVNDPLAENAGLTDPADKELVSKLLTLCRKAQPLNVALKAAFGSDQGKLNLSTSKIAVDSEHYRIDCEEAKVAIRKRSSSMAALPKSAIR